MIEDSSSQFFIRNSITWLVGIILVTLYNNDKKYININLLFHN